jgi:hypothetical protein
LQYQCMEKTYPDGQMLLGSKKNNWLKRRLGWGGGFPCCCKPNRRCRCLVLDESGRSFLPHWTKHRKGCRAMIQNLNHNLEHQHTYDLPLVQNNNVTSELPERALLAW